MKSFYLIFCLISSVSSAVTSCGSSNSREKIDVNSPVETPIPEEYEEANDHTPNFSVVDSSFQIPYALDKPDKTFKLPQKLQEISGLSLSEDQSKLCAIQDEKGKVYMINKSNGTVEQEIKFWKEGDYEGIEVANNLVYIVKSSGTLYEVLNLGKANQEVKKYNYFLNSENDVEGLGFDKKNNRLLIACKGLPATGEAFEVARFKKAVYAFDLTTKTLHPEPAFTISVNAIHTFLNTSYTEKNVEKLLSYFKPDQNLTFNPSAIAVHPLTENVYVLSSTKKMLIVLNPEGEILMMKKMDKSIHRQPEGITFDKEGTLFISNEGKGGIPRLYQFKYKANQTNAEKTN